MRICHQNQAVQESAFLKSLLVNPETSFPPAGIVTDSLARVQLDLVQVELVVFRNECIEQ